MMTDSPEEFVRQLGSWALYGECREHGPSCDEDIQGDDCYEYTQEHDDEENNGGESQQWLISQARECLRIWQQQQAVEDQKC